MQEKYILEKCHLNDFVISKEKIDLFFEKKINKYSDENYLYWDKIKYKKLEGFKNNKELWFYIKVFRQINIDTPINTDEGKTFKFQELEFSKKLLHELDKNASGIFFSNSSDSDKKMFIANGMLEEAISSSQLEGASTTRKNAEQLIKQGRKPINKSEQMIINNYNVMNYIKDDLIKKELELGDLLYLQGLLTKDTLDDKLEEGRFRKDSDNIVVEFERKISHTPMKEKFLKKELKNLINFANDKGDFDTFVHPVIKAIILHFWIGYLHPFCDGNGRTARALFYWYVLKNDYFGFSYIPLSTAIKESKIDYAKSYIYSEQDDLNLTYFINYNLRKIKISLDNFKKSVDLQFKRNNKDLKKLMHLELNDRQMKLINYFLKNNDSFTNIITHMNYYNISKQTSITDLKYLVNKGYLYSKKTGRKNNYFPVFNLEEIIKKGN